MSILPESVTPHAIELLCDVDTPTIKAVLYVNDLRRAETGLNISALEASEIFCAFDKHRNGGFISAMNVSEDTGKWIIETHVPCHTAAKYISSFGLGQLKSIKSMQPKWDVFAILMHIINTAIVVKPRTLLDVLDLWRAVNPEKPFEDNMEQYMTSRMSPNPGAGG